MLVVEPTPLEKSLVKLDHLPRYPGKHEQYVETNPPSLRCLQAANNGSLIELGQPSSKMASSVLRQVMTSTEEGKPTWVPRACLKQCPKNVCCHENIIGKCVRVLSLSCIVSHLFFETWIKVSHATETLKNWLATSPEIED